MGKNLELSHFNKDESPSTKYCAVEFDQLPLLRHRARWVRELVLGHVELDVQILQLLGVDGVGGVDHRRDAAPEAAGDRSYGVSRTCNEISGARYDQRSRR